MKVTVDILSPFQCPWRENEYGKCLYWSNKEKDCEWDIYGIGVFPIDCPLKKLAIAQTNDSIKFFE